MKRKLVLVLCLFVCVGVFCACTDKEYWGVYKEQGGGTFRSAYIELKSGDFCEYYILDNSIKTKEDAKGMEGYYVSGTYKVTDKTITLYFIQFGPDGLPSEWTGTILGNGNLSMPVEGGTTRVFKK